MIFILDIELFISDSLCFRVSISIDFLFHNLDSLLNFMYLFVCIFFELI
jgi:hypothetical protein